MSPPDYSTWLTKDQAAAAIGVSTKTIETFAKDGQLQQTVWRPQNRGAARAVYHPDDVARIAQARQRGPLPAFVVPASTGPANGNGHGAIQTLTSASSVVPTGEDVLRLVFAAALRQLTSDPAPTSESSAKPSETHTLYVSVKEAAAILGLPQADVRRLIHDGDLNHRVTGRGGIRIRRRDLEAL